MMKQTGRTARLFLRTVLAMVTIAAPALWLVYRAYGWDVMVGLLTGLLVGFAAGLAPGWISGRRSMAGDRKKRPAPAQRPGNWIPGPGARWASQTPDNGQVTVQEIREPDEEIDWSGWGF